MAQLSHVQSRLLTRLLAHQPPVLLGVVGVQQFPLVDRGGVLKLNLRGVSSGRWGLLQLLARGLLLLISATPKFPEASFVIRFDQAGGIAAAVDACVRGFEQLQCLIEQYCAFNSPELRLPMLL